MVQLLRMKKLPSKNTIQNIASELNISPSFVEKDWYAVQVLSAIASVNIFDAQIIFSGGTALSKAHCLIERYSEDLDFRVVIQLEEKSRSAQRKLLSEFKEGLVSLLKESGFNVNDETIKARDEGRFFSLEIDYKSYFEKPSALRPHIQLEVAFNVLSLPPIILPVISFIAHIENSGSEVEGIPCLHPSENAADKLAAISWRIPSRKRGGDNDDPTIVRHVHDLAILEKHIVVDREFADLVLSAMGRDSKRGERLGSPSEKLHLALKVLQEEVEYQAEYKQFVENVSYAEKTLDYNQALESVERLIKFIIILLGGKEIL